MMDIEKSKLPTDAKEGDTLIIDDNEIVIDKIETEKRKKEIEDLTKDLWS